jgi:hypothetical protein
MNSLTSTKDNLKKLDEGMHIAEHHYRKGKGIGKGGEGT